MSALAPPPGRTWKVAVLAGMASYLDAGALVTSGIVLGGSYAEVLSLDAGTVGVLLGVQTLVFALGALCGGRLGDLFGRRRVFTLSLLLYAAGTVLLLLASPVWLLHVGVVAVGLAIGADLAASLALVNEESPDGHKGKMVILSNVLWIGGIVAAQGLSAVVGSWGLVGGRIMFAHLLVVAVVVLVLRFTLRESAEWVAARRAVEAPGDAEAVHFSRVGQLFRAPVVFPVVALGAYYATWNLGASTLGSFGTFLWTDLTGGGVAEYSRLSLLGLPIGFLAGLVFMRVVDRPTRRAWFAGGSTLILVAWALPALFGADRFTLIAVLLLSGLGNAFCGEGMYKVWSQELVPTLLRTTASGLTTAFARVVAALAAFGTPTLAQANPALLFWLLLTSTAVACAIGLFWVPRLPKARELEPVPDDGTAERSSPA
ncbi:MFS transporter [Saccharopolyspora hordei]|uniref:Inositol transporter-like SP family MFS transporter n=1 Tax=Saccharopolyspora hordei TaxID=1838 RepID=A0A853ARV0_9PSEU|nr:MFS transporter [Saccharopolyspora hordei]NYI84400.1 inositol transporter-like SP family MFS transporter [Saccharopolyspora hordei]